jgi:hypothetical protein
MSVRYMDDLDHWLDEVWAHCSNEPECSGYAASVAIRCLMHPGRGPIRFFLGVEATLTAMAETIVYRDSFGDVPEGGTIDQAPGLEAAKQAARLCRGQLRRFGIEANVQRSCEPAE